MAAYDIGAELVRHLKTLPELVRHTGGRIYREGQVRRDHPMPYALVDPISTAVEYNMDGEDPADPETWQITFWADSPEVAHEGKEALRLALSGYDGKVGRLAPQVVLISGINPAMEDPTDGGEARSFGWIIDLEIIADREVPTFR